MDLGQDVLRQLVRIPRVQAPAKLILVLLEVSVCQAFQRLDLRVIQQAGVLDHLSQRLLRIFGPSPNCREQRGTGDGIRDDSQDADEKIAIPFFHLEPLRRLRWNLRL